MVSFLGDYGPNHFRPLMRLYFFPRSHRFSGTIRFCNVVRWPPSWNWRRTRKTALALYPGASSFPVYPIPVYPSDCTRARGGVSGGAAPAFNGLAAARKKRPCFIIALSRMGTPRMLCPAERASRRPKQSRRIATAPRRARATARQMAQRIGFIAALGRVRSGRAIVRFAEPLSVGVPPTSGCRAFRAAT